MSVDKKIKSLRILARKNSITIINHIKQTHIARASYNSTKAQDLCMFCSSKNNLTKEHVIPRWTFENCTKRFFTTKINGLDQTYNKTTIPACSDCNNDRLSSLEKYINNLFLQNGPDQNYFSANELSNIIRWLEIIDFKFQVLNAKRVFTASKEKGFIPYLADFPLSVLRDNINYSPSKAVSELRRSQSRITKKSKSLNLNSLVVLKTLNKSFHFFHKMDEFIFIELPQFNLALFYFFKRTFLTIHEGQIEAMKIIEQAYNR
ncbi:hypothetical protein [Adhaeribacter pallidiroseus]|uniref:HNH domain-containing protein n=1 Tax=Adhaeribacter pallidiroseus TaxID=2072847 RepID=A0A369QQ66_9BACT|nr:hypothetical protein [Adhaeribacter pallidiroseus]RDC66530.1 hypothetical protein AHMF7616_05161 [Adhaeribacter pallidiroseus]